MRALFEAEVPFHTTLNAGGVELVLEPAASGGRKEAPPFHGIIGTDPAIRHLIEMIRRVAPSTAAVTVLGESGTGKELVAQALHAASTRLDRAFIPVNCAAISRELIESELFGHEKGAFTGALNVHKGAFEEADGGTLFLDEIGELPLELQAKLLRALESGEIKRVGASRPTERSTCASSAPPTATCSPRCARASSARISTTGSAWSPCTCRRCAAATSDLLALAEHFLERFTPRGQRLAFTPAAIERLG